MSETGTHVKKNNGLKMLIPHKNRSERESFLLDVIYECSEEIRQLEEIIRIQGECVDYYENLRNWGYIGKRKIMKNAYDIQPQDQEKIGDIYCGGKKARETKQQIKELLNDVK